MEKDSFEGYIGIPFGNKLLMHDILLLSIVVLLFCFAFIFNTYYPLLLKKIHSLSSTKERQNLFDNPMKTNLVFSGFMKFQSLFLCSIFFYLTLNIYYGIEDKNISHAFSKIFLSFCFVFVFYLIKQVLYIIYGPVFNENGRYKLWKANYETLLYLWGAMLYFPVLGMLFSPEYFKSFISVFVFLFVLFRIAVIYITIRIFFSKSAGLLYLNLYLCAQEIIPLLFLYKGLSYLHNIIGTSSLWH